MAANTKVTMSAKQVEDVQVPTVEVRYGTATVRYVFTDNPSETGSFSGPADRAHTFAWTVAGEAGRSGLQLLKDAKRTTTARLGSGDELELCLAVMEGMR